MIKLKDYLGTLISGVNQARVLADIESAKIAQAYANDSILKHFPIPRFRAQDVELDIPIAIDGFDEQVVRDYQPIENKSFNSGSYSAMKDSAKISSFSRASSVELKSQIAKQSRILETDLKADVPKNLAFEKYEERLGSILIDVLKKDKIEIENYKETRERFKNQLKENVLGSIEAKRDTNILENANVIVEASSLREIPNENIVRIKMKLFEDGMEWHTSQDANGNLKSSLLPE